MDRAPRCHTPVELLYTPWLGSALTKVKPDGRGSLMRMLSAASGPRFVTLMVNRMGLPSSWASRSVAFSTARSAICTRNTAAAVLSAELTSGRSIWVMLAVFVTQLPPEPAATVPVRVSVAVAPGASAPMFHTPLVELNAPVVAPEPE